jgi:hypothetical protein
MDELLLLKRLAREQDQMAAAVSETNQKFSALTDVVQSGQISGYPDQAAIQDAFGPPLVVESTQADEQVLERWLYRRSTDFFGSPKVYLYFNASGRLMKWDYINREPKE